MGWARALVAVSASATLATAELIESPEPGWPQWRGRRRDGISPETGLLREWPENGPPLVWTVHGLGRGWSSPVVSGGRIVVTGDLGDVLVIHALDMEGRVLWRATNGAAWKGPYPGARASCAIAGERVVHLNAHGRCAAYDVRDGRELWAVNVLERFEAPNIRWAISECLLVDRGRVLVTAGGARALIAALDLRDGSTVWASPPLRLGPSPSAQHQRLADPAGEADPAGYTSPVLLRVGERRVVVNCSNRHAFGADAETGQLLWTRPLPTRFQVLACTPVVWRDAVFVTGPDGEGGLMVRMRTANGELMVEDMWRSPLDTGQHGAVVAGDELFASFYREPRRWIAMEPATGRIRYEARDWQRGAPIWADGRLVIVSETGEVLLVEPTGSDFRIRGRFRIAGPATRDAWAHPVLVDGHLYLRHHDQMECRDVRGDRAAAR
ncbi:MAG: PQQ-binding-like beta-propeller repeat protein [Kiritimatiellae bacterium]|nr:PQQ-binding-like beta-propeller repeat protein [Kiritimatiellia bacterium]